MQLLDAPAGAGECGEMRQSLKVTEAEPPGHMVFEQEKATHEGRPPKNGYKNVPLTGCHQNQSVIPTYRRPGAFGSIAEPDEQGLFRVQQAADVRHVEDQLLLKAAAQPWVVDGSRLVAIHQCTGQC